MDISEFIQTRPTYPSLPDNYWENAEYEDEIYCNAWLQKYPEQERADIKGAVGIHTQILPAIS